MADCDDNSSLPSLDSEHMFAPSITRSSDLSARNREPLPEGVGRQSLLAKAVSSDRPTVPEADPNFRPSNAPPYLLKTKDNSLNSPSLPSTPSSEEAASLPSLSSTNDERGGGREPPPVDGTMAADKKKNRLNVGGLNVEEQHSDHGTADFASTSSDEEEGRVIKQNTSQNLNVAPLDFKEQIARDKALLLSGGSLKGASSPKGKVGGFKNAGQVEGSVGSLLSPVLEQSAPPIPLFSSKIRMLQSCGRDDFGAEGRDSNWEEGQEECWRGGVRK